MEDDTLMINNEIKLMCSLEDNNSLDDSLLSHVIMHGGESTFGDCYEKHKKILPKKCWQPKSAMEATCVDAHLSIFVMQSIKY